MTTGPLDSSEDDRALDADLAPGVPADAAIEFLDRLRPGGPWVLTAIAPDRGAQL